MAKTGTPTELGTQPIGKLLLQYAIPAIIAMTASSLYNMVDSIFIGHGVGPLANFRTGYYLPTDESGGCIRFIGRCGCLHISFRKIRTERLCHRPKYFGQCSYAELYYRYRIQYINLVFSSILSSTSSEQARIPSPMHETTWSLSCWAML